MATWRELISDDMKYRGESLSTSYTIFPPDLDLDKEFDDGFGGSEGEPFTLWTENFIYFPAVYDGSEWVESVPRNPCDSAKGHVGGE